MQGEAARGRRVGAATKAAHARLPRGRRAAARTAGGAAALLPRQANLLGEETRQIVSPIFAVEFWSSREVY